MTQMNNSPEIIITENEKKLLNQKLMILLSKRVRRFSHGDSSSIPAEMADELLKSICYTLSISLDKPDERWKSLLKVDLELELKRCSKEIETKIAYGQKLCKTIIDKLPEYVSTTMLATLKSLESSWIAYDYQYFAHLFPCSIDYQLAIPVPDSLQGVDYINRYLTHLFLENSFISYYKPTEVETVLSLYTKDYKDSVLNHFEPIVTNAIGLAVLNNYNRLIMSKDDVKSLYTTFENMSKPKILETLVKASDNLLVPFSANKKALTTYLHHYCRDLTARIVSMRECGGLEGIFLTSVE